MLDRDTLNQIVSALQGYWDSGRFHQIARRISSAESLGQLDPSVQVTFTLSAEDISVLHGALVLSLHYRKEDPEDDSGDSPEPNPTFDPSHN